jgi:hypothetical protein
MNSKNKNLLCRSTTDGVECKYHKECSYSHSLEHQHVVPERNTIYKIIIDPKLKNFYLDDKNGKLYSDLLQFTNLCSRCVIGKCIGGYNCKNGATEPCWLICKSDFMTKSCKETIIPIIIDTNKFGSITCNFYGCEKGHHLTLRNMPCYVSHIYHNYKSDDIQNMMNYIYSDELKEILKEDISIKNSALDNKLDSIMND